MISGNTEHKNLNPYLSPTIVALIEETGKIIASAPEDGKYPLSKQDCFVNIVSAQTKHIAECRPEIHRKYIDVQWLISGSEAIGYGHQTVEQLETDLLDSQDVAFIKDIAQEKSIRLEPNDFAIFYPGEVHRPLVATEQQTPIRKAIIKIPVDMV